MFAHPATSTGPVVVDLHLGGGEVLVPQVGGTLVSVLAEVVAAHHPGEAVVKGQHEGDGGSVLLGGLVGHHVAPSAMSTLVVVVVSEDKGPVRWSHPPAWVVQSPKLSPVPISRPSDLLAVSELGDPAEVEVLVHKNRAVVPVDHLVVEEGGAALLEPVPCGQVVETSLNRSGSQDLKIWKAPGCQQCPQATCAWLRPP